MRLKAGISLSGHYSSPASNDKMGRKNGEIMFIFKNHNKIRQFITNKSARPVSAFPLEHEGRFETCEASWVRVCGHFTQLEIKRKRKLLGILR